MFNTAQLQALATEIHGDAVAKGWYVCDDHGKAVVTTGVTRQKAVLEICEMAEFYEEFRKPHLAITECYEKDGKPEGFPIEMADLLIRCLDLAAAVGIVDELEAPSKEDVDEVTEMPDLDTIFLMWCTHIASNALLGKHNYLIAIISDVVGYCEKEGVDLEAAVKTKMAFNKTRPYRHGNKRA